MDCGLKTVNRKTSSEAERKMMLFFEGRTHAASCFVCRNRNSFILSVMFIVCVWWMDWLYLYFSFYCTGYESESLQKNNLD